MLYLGELKQSISRLKGIGPSSKRDMEQLGINTIGDLLRHYPSRYENRKDTVTLAESNEDKEANTVVTVGSHEWIGHGVKRTLKVWVSDGTADMALLCFGRNFLEQKLVSGSTFLLFAKVQIKFGERQSSSFEFELPSESPDNFGKILPIYPLSGKLHQQTLRKAVYQALNEWMVHIEEELPELIRQRYGFPGESEIIRSIHYPESMEEMIAARRALIYQEWFHLQLISGRRLLKNRKRRKNKVELHQRALEKQIFSLSFQLTEDQNKALKDIQNDFASSYAMNRLIQGEVGSGKTLIAFLAAVMVMADGGQAAMMAPTELLARQHADNAAALLHDWNVALLTGQTSRESREHIKSGLKNGSIQLLLGTHALFSEDVEFKKLDLVIVDEQHRFGVKQRQELIKKGNDPHILLMTATPIPRTLAITAFGDLEISTIRTMPKGRIPIETHLAQKGKESKVYDFVHGQLQQGHQAYFVYPLIEESEKLDLKDAESTYRLLKEKIFPQYRLALIHSRIDEEEKRNSMEAFVKGEVDILVATSVVEVGVDVANATVMVVEQAERFGLSALHQLRGRVGRGQSPSYTFLVFGEKLTEEGKQRLRYMKQYSSGFDIAQKDLELRGAGDIAGFRQSGFMKLRIGQLERDQDVIETVRKDVLDLLQKDPGLLYDEHKVLRELLAKAPPFSDSLISRG